MLEMSFEMAAALRANSPLLVVAEGGLRGSTMAPPLEEEEEACI